MPSKKTFNDDDFAKKIIALSNYDCSLVSTVYESQRGLIEAGAAKILVKYFEHLVDAKARANPELLHHVYEFNMSGKKEGRLFKSKIIQTDVGAVVSFSFKPSKKPNNNGYMFYNKAQVMESGQTVIIRPKKSKYLVYRLNDGRFIKTSKPSIVSNPGGPVKGNFEKEFNQFMSVTGNIVLKNSKYFERINSMIELKRDITAPSINRLTTLNFVAKGTADGMSIAQEAYRIGNWLY